VIHELVDAHPGAKEALCDQTRRLTYSDLAAESNSLARFLLDEGVESDVCVAVQSPNVVELAVVHLACSRIGATFVPLSDAWRQTELRHLLELSAAQVLLVPPARDDFDFYGEVAAMRGSLPGLRLLASLDGVGDFDLPEILALRVEPVVRRAGPNDPRYVMASSGTTSLPKLSLWTDNNLWAFAKAWIDAVALTPDDRIVGLAPAGTGAIGYVYGILFPLLGGATSILLERWDPAEALTLIERERATIVSAVPTQLVKVLQEPAARRSTHRSCVSSRMRARRCRPTWRPRSRRRGTAGCRRSTARPTAACR
jgi:Acyl-CoA synthetases (AMP-forming)/AMP-acid ligases II